MNNSKNEIRVENVSFSYDKTPVIKNAHFHIEKGSFVSFVGKNGGGKSTMAKLILGLLDPDNGYISIFGKNPKAAASLLSYVPQHPQYDTQFPITVFDVVLSGKLGPKFGFLNKADKKVAQKALAIVRMEDFAHRQFSQLSGGQRQRVLIARALVKDPEILILDEPTSAIDAESQQELYALLKELNKNKTIILISHDLEFVAEEVTKVICINKKVEIHPTGQFTNDLYNRLYGRTKKIVRHDTKLEERHD